MTYSPLATPRATLDMLAAHGLSTKKSLGQHFLVDDNIVGRILELACLERSETVLEVGPGIGTLTAALCTQTDSVLAIERDERLRPVLADTLADYPGAHVLFADAMALTAGEIEETSGPVDAFVANLPYGVAATLVLRFFEELPSMNRAIVMVQAEVADRMVAVPGTKDYGSYSVKLQLRARPGGRFAVAPGCFLPPPRVNSAVVRLDRADWGRPDHEIVSAARVADMAFAQRRKTLRNTLKAGLQGGSEAAIELLSSANVDPGLRAERLSVETYLELGKNAYELGLLP